MPVPVSISNPNGVGLTAAAPSELPSEGPFERMARMRAEAEAEAAANPAQQPEQMQVDHPTDASETTTSDSESNDSASDEPIIKVSHLNFSYPDITGQPKPGAHLIQDMNLSLKPGETCLLIGANGAGKTTLLNILAGKHMVDKDAVHVMGQSAFHAVNLTTSGALNYIGGEWTRDVAFAGYAVPLTGDFSAEYMLNTIHNACPKRKKRLVEVLDINLNWRMHQVSDGQRRRVQLAMGLMRPFKVLLLDEITVDLDVLGRADLMDYLKEECQERGAAIIYATHIFDGLEKWPSHLCYVAHGSVQLFKPAAEIPELAQGDLLGLVEKWLRKAKADEQERKKHEVKRPKQQKVYASNNGYGAGRLASTLAGGNKGTLEELHGAKQQTVPYGMQNSSNTVWRC